MSKNEHLKSLVSIRWRKKIKAWGERFLRKAKVDEIEVTEATLGKTREEKKPVVVIWSAISYDFRHQRPQEWAERLAADGYLVIYVENEFLTAADRRRPPFKVVRRKENLWLLTLSADQNQFIYVDIPGTKTREVIKRSWQRFKKWSGVGVATFLMEHPFWGNMEWLKTTTSGGKTIYEIFDYHEGFDLKAKNLAIIEKDLAQTSDKVIVSSEFLVTLVKDKYRVAAKKITKIGNGVALESFSIPEKRKKLVDGGKKVIGYCGAIEEWLDVELLEMILKAYPEAELRLIGRVNNKSVKKLSQKYENLTLRGEIPYAKVPQEVTEFDAALIPFLLTDLIKATSPVKYFEYLALGKAVVSVDLPELNDYGSDLVYLGKNRADFVAKIKMALAESELSYDKIEKLATKRRKVAQMNSWQEKYQALKKVINQ